MSMTPRDVIERLKELQELDRRLATLDKEITGGPKAVESFARSVAAVDARIALVEERLKLLRAQVKLRENESQVAQTRVDRLNEQARTVKNNKEFTAIRSEIANAKIEVSRLDDEILKIMQAVEEQEKSLVTAREERAREQRRLDSERAKVESALDGLRKSREDQAKGRPALTTGLPAEPLSIYERVQRARGDAVVPLEIDYCTGCMERLTRNDVFAVQNASRLVACRSCGRILYAQ